MRGDVDPEARAVLDHRELKESLKALIVSECDSDVEASEIADDVPLLGDAYGFDSLDALQICMAVQAKYGVRIEGGRATRLALRSVDSLARTIQAASER